MTFHVISESLIHLDHRSRSMKRFAKAEAGLLDRCMLPELTPQRLEVTTRPKAHGVGASYAACRMSTSLNLGLYLLVYKLSD